ncbi:uncharacterized protein LOC143514290 [Brachyhypopomus gauderio]|uniref:uncharacterized protein LOC143514290 n=1 Tax=Brachyhypopomus gauderio TaxID=698409 RepID=UPI0040420E43
MPGYTSARKKGKKKAKHHHSSSPARHHDTPIPVGVKQQEPVCAYLLRQALAAESEEGAEVFLLAAQRVWEGSHCSPPPAYPEEDLREDPFFEAAWRKGLRALRRESSPPASGDEGEEGPLVVYAGMVAATPPELDTESEESGEEETGDRACYTPSVYSTPTVCYGGREEDVSPPSSVYSAPTVCYGGSEEDVSPPSSVYSAPTVCYDGREDDVSPPPSEYSVPTVCYDGREDDVSPPPSEYSVPTVCYGGKEGVSPTPSEWSVPTAPYGEEEDSLSVCSEETVRSEKGCPDREKVPCAPLEGSKMSWSRYPDSEEPMAVDQELSEEEEMETAGDEKPLPPRGTRGDWLCQRPGVEVEGSDRDSSNRHRFAAKDTTSSGAQRSG